ncbi:MAG: major capsid protein [Microvirus sp.]|nr:MAG: major capsid protein [Microvirus sp.]
MSQNKNIFNDVSSPNVKKSWFDMGNTHLTSMNFGELVPVYCQPTLPGSVFKMSHEWLLKTSAMIAPVMHRNQIYIHTFFVPYRNLWDNWTNFITETKIDGVLPSVPFFNIDSDDADLGRLGNYLGIPFPSTVPGGSSETQFTAFWWAAYQFIWNEYYRDQNLQAEVDYSLIDGDNSADYVGIFKDLKKRAWMHDYFTSALPDTQKGDAVNIPMTFDDVDVYFKGAASGNQVVQNSADVPYVGGVLEANNPTGNLQRNDSGTQTQAWLNPGDTLAADTSELLASAGIIDLRIAEQLQRFRELMMTHGSRYNEFLEAIYSYKIKDETIQRPVYLGGSRADLIISETLNTSGNEALNLPQGNKSGNAQSYANGGNINYMCPEHGVIMSIMSVMPDSMYFQGIPKEFMKMSDPFEYGNPLMANIGEQPVLKGELYGWQGATDAETFGYQMRYAEYKQTFNRISADMTSSLLFWNEARNFATNPTLNSDFITCDHANDDLGRIFNVEDAATQKLWAMIRTNANVLHPLPYFGTPMLGQ